MRFLVKVLLFLISLTLLFGCAYRHYLGLHGPSIRAHWEVHAGIVEDRDCLRCHHPDRDPSGPPTSHPNFRGCLKCHNDEVKGEGSVK